LLVIRFRISGCQALQGDLLFAIDCRPYEARLARARADLALAVKEVEAQRKTIASATSEIARREASLGAATAGVTRSDQEREAAEAPRKCRTYRYLSGSTPTLLLSLLREAVYLDPWDRP